MNDVIQIRRLAITTIVGALPDERVTPQLIELDIDMARPFAAAAAHDDLSQTTNYAAVISQVVDVVQTGQFILLETLVARVARAILQYDEHISSVTVTVRKMNPPVPETVGTVGASTTRSRY
jgi:dihydroneopterin aldolase